MDEYSSHKTFEVEELRAHHVELMQLINLDLLLPLLIRRNVLSKQDMKRVQDTDHYGSIERAGFLLNIIYKQDGPTVNKFVQCLREEKRHDGHQEVVGILEEETMEEVSQNPMFEILHGSLEEVAEVLNLTSFLQSLVDMEAIEVETFLHLVGSDRTVTESLEKLLLTLEGKGTQGFISFLTALKIESSSPYDKLFKKLLSKAQKFFKEDERRGEVSYSDRIAILQLETREKVLENEVSQRFKVNFDRLVSQLDLQSLKPYLHKSLVLSVEELKEATPGAAGNKTVLKLIESKGPFWLVKFAECLREDPKNQELSKLLYPPPPPAPVKKADVVNVEHRHDKVAVFMSMHRHVRVDEHYAIDEHITIEAEKKVLQERSKLLSKFESLRFKIIEFELRVSSYMTEEKKKESSKRAGVAGGQGEWEGQEDQAEEKLLEEQFKEKVVGKCAEEAIVFIYMSGIQIPFEEPGGKRTGAILLSEVSTLSRKENAGYIKASTIRRWLGFIPTCHVTFLVDCEHNFISRYGKRRSPDSVDMVEDPWSMLTDLDFTTVVYYLQPDMVTLPQKRDEEVRRATGSLTECFSSALDQCFKKREGSVPCLSHHRFYEAVSFFWHKRGRMHKSFVPAVVGDKDREFLGRKGIPYQHVFMINLNYVNNEFNLDVLYIQIGSLVGLQAGDTVEMFHVLRPGVHVRGVVKESNPISCSIEIRLQSDRNKLRETLGEIYRDKSLYSKDHSTEYLWAFKVFSAKDRYPVATDGLNESDLVTLKTYLDDVSPHLSHATRGTQPTLKVCASGGRYHVQDLDGEVKQEVKVKRLQLVFSFLELIAWYKYTIHIGDKEPVPPLTSFRSFLTSERPLLQDAVPLRDEFCFKWSSFEGAITSSSKLTGHEMILLQNTESQTYWKPDPPARDPNPCLEVEFFRNRIITAIELKGDKTSYVKEAKMFYQNEVLKESVVLPAKAPRTCEVPVKRDYSVQFVSIAPQEKKDFTLSFRLFFSPSRPLLSVSISNWIFHQQRKTPWKFNPPPDSQGCIRLSPGQQWISWSGKAHFQDPVVFDLGLPGYEIEYISFTSPTEESTLSKFNLQLKSTWKPEELPPFPSAWPCKYEFPRPLVMSNLQLWPLHYARHKDVKVQWQLYGNKYGVPVEVVTGEMLSFHFNNYTNESYFVYIMCLEESGTIKHLMKSVADRVHTKENKTIYPVLKKLIESSIPTDYNPESGSIKDIYKVFVCQRQLYLDPFFQKGPSSYHHAVSYRATSSLGRKEMRKDKCHFFEFHVNVKQKTK